MLFDVCSIDSDVCDGVTCKCVCSEHGNVCAPAVNSNMLRESPIDRTAMIALFHATNGPAWENTWDLSKPMSTWYGVTLDDEGRVM